MSHMSNLNIDQLNKDNEPLTEWDAFAIGMIDPTVILKYLIAKEKGDVK